MFKNPISTINKRHFQEPQFWLVNNQLLIYYNTISKKKSNMVFPFNYVCIVYDNNQKISLSKAKCLYIYFFVCPQAYIITTIVSSSDSLCIHITMSYNLWKKMWYEKCVCVSVALIPQRLKSTFFWFFSSLFSFQISINFHMF